MDGLTNLDDDLVAVSDLPSHQPLLVPAGRSRQRAGPTLSVGRPQTRSIESGSCQAMFPRWRQTTSEICIRGLAMESGDVQTSMMELLATQGNPL
jgi:hypothetical protein